MPHPLIGFNAKVAIKDNAGAFADLADTCTFNLPDVMIEEGEDKRLTAGRYKQFFPKLAEYGEVTVELLYTKANYVRIRALIFTNPMDFQLFAPDDDGAGANVAEIGTVTGFVKKINGAKFAKGDETYFSFQLRVNAVVISAATNNYAAAPTTA